LSLKNSPRGFVGIGITKIVVNKDRELIYF